MLPLVILLDILFSNNLQYPELPYAYNHLLQSTCGLTGVRNLSPVHSAVVPLPQKTTCIDTSAPIWASSPLNVNFARNASQKRKALLFI